MTYSNALGKGVPLNLKVLKAHIKNSNDFHKLEVQDAIKADKPVPPEVLKDYPDLAPSVPPAKPPVVPEATLTETRRVEGGTKELEFKAEELATKAYREEIARLRGEMENPKRMFGTKEYYDKELGRMYSEKSKKAWLLAKKRQILESFTQPQSEAKPAAKGDFGPVFTQFKGKPQEAIEHLLQVKDGEAVSALHHKDIGEIDLVWGKEGTPGKDYKDGYGLAKIAKKHPTIINNLQEIISRMSVSKQDRNRAILESLDHRAIVRLRWNDKIKNWLLTAYETEEPPHTRGRTGVPGNKGGMPPIPRGGSTKTIPPIPGEVKPFEKTPIHELDPKTQDTVKYEAGLMKEEIKQAIPNELIINRRMTKTGEEYVPVAVSSTYPEYYGTLKRSRKDVRNALEKIVKDAGKDKGKLVEQLKAIIEKRLKGEEPRYAPGTGQPTKDVINYYQELETVVGGKEARPLIEGELAEIGKLPEAEQAKALKELTDFFETQRGVVPPKDILQEQIAKAEKRAEAEIAPKPQIQQAGITAESLAEKYPEASIKVKPTKEGYTGQAEYEKATYTVSGKTEAEVLEKLDKRLASVIPYEEAQPTRKREPEATAMTPEERENISAPEEGPSGYASIGGYKRPLKGMEMPEIVELAKEINQGEINFVVCRLVFQDNSCADLFGGFPRL